MEQSMTDSVRLIKKQFLCGVPLYKFNWTETLKTIDEETQKQIMDLTVNNQLVLKYPLKKSYQIAFLSAFRKKLEEFQEEIIDDVYVKYCEMISTKNQEDSLHYRHFLLDDRGLVQSLIMKESTNIISQGTTGSCSWQAALGLAEWCFANANELKGKSILELGSGVGLTGLAVTTCCSPRKYVFSDCHPSVLNLLRANIELNLFSAGRIHTSNDNLPHRYVLQTEYNKIQVDAININWNEIDECINDDNLDPDVVIAADVLYDNSNFKDLANTLRSLLQKSSRYAIIAATVRNEETVSEFLNELGCHNLTYEEEVQPIPEVFFKSEEAPNKVYRILLKSR